MVLRAGETTVLLKGGVFPDATYAGTRDVTVADGWQDSWNPNANYSVNGGYMRLDGDPIDTGILMRWDVSAIPPSSTVVAASLTAVLGQRDGAEQRDRLVQLRQW